MKDLAEYLLPIEKIRISEKELEERNDSALYVFNWMYQFFKEKGTANAFLRLGAELEEILVGYMIMWEHWEDICWACGYETSYPHYICEILEAAGIETTKIETVTNIPFDVGSTVDDEFENIQELKDQGYGSTIHVENAYIKKIIVDNIKEAEIEYFEHRDNLLVVKDYFWSDEYFLRVEGDNLAEIMELWESTSSSHAFCLEGQEDYLAFVIPQEDGWDFFDANDFFMNLLEYGLIDFDYEDLICREPIIDSYGISGMIEKLDISETREVIF